MSRLVFRDFDEFADSIAGIAGRFVPTARSSAEWWVDAVPAGVLSLQQIQIGGSATFAGDGAAGSFTLGIPMTKPQCIRIDGQRLDGNSFIVLKQDQPFTFAGQDVTRWAGVTLPIRNRSGVPAELSVMGRLLYHPPISSIVVGCSRLAR